MSVRFLGSRGGRVAALLLVLGVTSNCGGGDGGDVTGPPPGPAPVATVEVAPGSVNLTAGETLQLTATPKATDGAALTGRTVMWSTSDEAVAEVSESGMVTAAAPGDATITATSEGKTGAASVTVHNVPVATVEVIPNPATVTVGQTGQLAVVLEDATGAELTGREVVWSTSDPAVATVTEQGVVTGVAAGEATITATSEGQSGSTLVTVSAVPVESVDVTPATLALQAGESAQLTAVAKAADGSILPDRLATWRSTDASVARVGPTGVVTGVGPGSTRVIATIDAAADTTRVSVTSQPVATVEINPSVASVAVGAGTQLSVITKAADGTVLTGRAVGWTSSAPSVATVSNSGQVTGVAAGTATIKATSEGVNGTATITVTATPEPVASVKIEQGDVVVIRVGETFQFTAVAEAADGSALTGRTITWAVGTPAVARIDGNGLATGLAEGSTVVTATSEGKTGRVTLSVGPAAGTIRTWRGGSSARPTDWSTASNWNPSGKPSISDTARIAPASNPATLAADEQIARLIIAGGRLHTAGHRLTIRKP